MHRKCLTIPIYRQKQLISWSDFSKEFPREAACLDSVELDNNCPGLYFEVQGDRLGLGVADLDLSSLSVDWVAKWRYHQRFFARHPRRKEPFFRACAVKKNKFFLDATAGLGFDSLLLAFFGAHVCMVERNPFIYALLVNALHRFEQVFAQEAKQLAVVFSEAQKEVEKNHYHGVFYDPMYQEPRQKTAPRKEMRIFRELGLAQENSQQSIQICQQLYDSVGKRLVIKRPARAQPLWRKPDMSYVGKSTRYDVYLKPQ